MPSWPSTLPVKPLAGTHQTRAQPNVVTFQSDVGEPIRRRRYTGRASTDNFDLILTPAQTATLRDFWDYETTQGALSFDATLVDGVLRTWWFSPDAPPQFNNIRGGGNYRVTLSLGCRR